MVGKRNALSSYDVAAASDAAVPPAAPPQKTRACEADECTLDDLDLAPTFPEPEQSIHKRREYVDITKEDIMRAFNGANE
eukprot:4244767-Pyramimonas_sp.AAC.1